MHAQIAGQAPPREAATAPRLGPSARTPLRDRRERRVAAARRDLAAWLDRITGGLEGEHSVVSRPEHRDVLGRLLGQADNVRHRIALTASLPPGPAQRSLDRLQVEVQSVTRDILRLLTAARDTNELAPVIALVRPSAAAPAHRRRAV